MFVERKFHRLALHNLPPHPPPPPSLSLSFFLILFILNQRYDELIRFTLQAVELPHGEANAAVGVPNLTLALAMKKDVHIFQVR